MAKSNYDKNAVDDYIRNRELIINEIESAKEAIYDKYGFELRYDDIYLVHPYERTLYIT